MIEYQYKPSGNICVSMMKISIDETTDTIHSISILGGCHGNITAIMKLLRGRKVQDVIQELDGIQCGRRGTSCPDQIAKALKQYVEGRKN